MNNVSMANMGPMGGGPVGAPMPMMNNGAMPPQNGPKRMQVTPDTRSRLNTYIYDYFNRSGMWDCARALLNSDSLVSVKKEPGTGGRDENGGLLGNGLGSDDMDTDSKDDIDSKRPEDLPPAAVPQSHPESCFLFEWFCIFWEIMQSQNAQAGKSVVQPINQYVQHAQQVSTSTPIAPLLAATRAKPVCYVPYANGWIMHQLRQQLTCNDRINRAYARRSNSRCYETSDLSSRHSSNSSSTSSRCSGCNSRTATWS
jgi:hypothetical protein